MSSARVFKFASALVSGVSTRHCVSGVLNGVRTLRPLDAAGHARLFSNGAPGNTESSIPTAVVAPEGHSEEQRGSDPYTGISVSTFPEDITKILLHPLDPKDVEIKPDGLCYLPEIKYRRILNQAFGPGGWALMPRGEVQHFKNETEGAQLITREYAMYCLGRFVAQAMGEHTFYTKLNLSYGKAVESAKSNALMRCCKDLGIASELWDPTFLSQWKSNHASEIWCENVRTKDKKKLWKKNGSRDLFPYPWKEVRL